MIGTEEGLPEAGVAAVTVTDDQRVWVGTSQGLYSVSGGHTAPLSVRLELEGSVTALHVDTENRLWLARVFRGARRFEIGTGGATGAAPALRVIDEFSGFAGTVGGRPDGWPAAARSHDGRIWFATSRGLAVIESGAASPTRPGAGAENRPRRRRRA